MKWLLKSFRILVAVLACLVNNSNLAEAEDRCDANNPCTDPTAPCCTQYGHCGFDELYCGKGCQSQCELPPSPLPSDQYACGRMASNALCPTPENPCYSKYGYRGNDTEHCGLDVRVSVIVEVRLLFPLQGLHSCFLGAGGF